MTKLSWLEAGKKRIVFGVDRLVLDEFDALEEHRSFAETSLANALKSLKARVNKDIAGLSDEDRDAYHDQMHEHYVSMYEVIPRIQWNSQFLVVYSSFEHTLNELCRIVQRRSAFELSFKDLSGLGIERAKNYLSKVAGIKTPFEKPSWARARLLGEIRNAIAHRNGDIELHPNDQKSLGARLSKETHLNLKKSIPEQDDAQIVLSSAFVRTSISELRDVLVNIANYELYADKA